MPLRERRHRQGRRLQHGGAAAGQDRRLRRLREGRPVEDRRGAAREAASTIRLDYVHRSRPHPPRRPASSASVYAEKGYQFAEVKPTIKEVAGGPKMVHLTFHITEGPKVKIREVEFVGNKAIGDGKLRGKMKENKAQRLLRVHHRRRHLQGREVRRRRRERRRATTATRATSRRRSASPDLKILEDDEGRQDALGAAAGAGHRGRPLPGSASSTFDGNTVVKAEALRPLFKIEAGRVLQREEDPEGPREGARGLRRRRLLRVHRLSRSEAARPAAADGNGADGRAGPHRPPPPSRRASRPADRRRRRCGCRKASSTSSTASRSSATRRRATTSSAARCGCSRPASSTPRR